MTMTAMTKIERDSLLSLEAYAKQRARLRAEVIEHKKTRKVFLGEHVMLDFEDETTVRYQIQEMLRAERIYEEEGILSELEAYGPLVPDGRNFKATMMLEFPDPELRREWLSRLIGVEDRVWVQVAGHGRVMAIADEDLDRETDEKTSSVHFLRFELDDAMALALKAGAALRIGCDHPSYTVEQEVLAPVRASLSRDLA
jgi:hypothetical protein